MFKLVLAQSFFKPYKSLIKKNPHLKIKVIKTLKNLAKNSKDPSLFSHKVNSKKFGLKWASKVIGDLRVIWDYDKNKRLKVM